MILLTCNLQVWCYIELDMFLPIVEVVLKMKLVVFGEDA